MQCLVLDSESVQAPTYPGSSVIIIMYVVEVYNKITRIRAKQSGADLWPEDSYESSGDKSIYVPYIF